jgi:GT2 family glycosyltransferase
VTPEGAAILVNYNAGTELRTALQSILDEGTTAGWEVVVVDNASTDGSAAVVAEFGRRVTLVRNAVNVGFGRAVNQGVASSMAPLILLMNPDCRLVNGAISRLRAVLDADPSCAIAGPRVLDPDGAVQASARGDPDMLTGLFGRTGGLRALLPLLPVSRRNVVVQDAISSGRDSVVVDWVSGACMLLRREAFLQAGGFDERYFLYWEDADLCRRLRRLGHRVRYVPGATAVHQVGRSSETAKASSIRAFHASANLYYATHVASSPLDPRRVLARALLAARCRWQLRALRTQA